MRRPSAVLVFIFRRTQDSPEYALLQRADDENWQSVSGGVEDGEDLPTAACRETAEETGLSGENPLFKLDMVSGVEKTCFAAHKFWPEGLYIVPKHFFAMDVGRNRPTVLLPQERTDVRWLHYDAAYKALRHDDDKTALWELEERIRRDDLPDVL